MMALVESWKNHRSSRNKDEYTRDELVENVFFSQLLTELGKKVSHKIYWNKNGTNKFMSTSRVRMIVAQHDKD